MCCGKRCSFGTAQERKNVSDGNEHYPIGQWILQHPAGYVMAAVSQILIEETWRQGHLSSLNALSRFWMCVCVFSLEHLKNLAHGFCGKAFRMHSSLDSVTPKNVDFRLLIVHRKECKGLRWQLSCELRRCEVHLHVCSYACDTGEARLCPRPAGRPYHDRFLLWPCGVQPTNEQRQPGV